MWEIDEEGKERTSEDMMKNIEKNRVRCGHRGRSHGFSRLIRIWLGLLVVVPLFAVSFHAGPVQAQGGVGYVEFYIPGDEADIINALKDIPTSGVNTAWTAANINSAVDVISSNDDINVYLDEWEDGYDLDPADPYNTADAKWCLTDGTELDTGEVLTLRETDTYAAGSEGVDARDRIYVTGGPVNVVRTVWPDDSPGTYIAGSWELYPTMAWQSAYTVPVGTDTELPAGEYPFLYTYLFVQAKQDNTRVVVDDPAVSGIQIDTVLSQGQTLMYPSAPYPPQGVPGNTCHQGTTVVATDNTSGEPVFVQAHITSSSNIEFDFRYYTLTPEEYLGNSYMVPVPSMIMEAAEASGQGRSGHPQVDTAIYIYSFQDNTDVWVETISGTTQLDGDLDGGEVIRYLMPQMDTANGVFDDYCGARIYINNPRGGDKIWALGAGDDSWPTLDWGFQTLSPAYLTNYYFLPWAPSNPTYVTPIYDNTLFFVDWDLDGTVDQTFTLHRFQIRMLYPPATANPNTGENYDGTGAHIWANRQFVLAWGQDHSQRTVGPENDNFPPDLDWGHSILPLYWYDPVLNLDKSANPSSLGPGGGTVTFTLVLTAGEYTVYDIDMIDVLPTGWEYVDDSTTITLSYGTGGSGDGYDPSIAGSTLTWDLGGLGLNDDMPADATITLTFDAQTLTGQYTCGANVNSAEAYGIDGKGGVFRPDDRAIVDIVCLEIIKNSDTGGQPVEPGDTITYTIQVTNNASTTQTGITINDPLPSYTDYVAQSTVVAGYVVVGGTQTVRDEFNAVSYSNNDGTQNWAGDWDETNDDDSPSGGAIQVVSGRLRCRQLQNNQSIERSVDLTGATSATLTFAWEVSGLEEDVWVQVWDETNSEWDEVNSYSGGSGSGTETYVLGSEHIFDNTTIRIINTGTSWNYSNDEAYFDDVQIEATFPGSGSTAATKDNVPGGTYPDLVDGDPPTLVDAGDGFILEPGQTMTATFQVQVESYIPSYITEIENEACVSTDQLTEQLCASVSDRPTLVALTSFNAYEEGGQVVVEWETAAEIGTVGFYLARLDKERRTYVWVNTELLPGLLHSPQGGVYRLIDDDAVPGRTYTYKLVEVEARGKKRQYGPFTVSVGGKGVAFSKGKGLRSARKAMSSRFDRKAHAMSAHKKARISARKQAREAARGLSLRWRRQGGEAKISLAEKGLYYLNASDIAPLLGMTPRRVQRLIEGGGLALNNRGQSVAYIPAGESSGLYFYGEEVESIYTDENVYWLTQGRGSKMEVLGGTGPSPAGGDETFAEVLHLEEDQWALTSLFDDPEADFWLWEYIFAGGPGASVTVSANGVAPGGVANLMVLLKGGSDTEVDPDHHVVVSLNGTAIGSDYWDGTAEHELVLSFDQSLLNDGENTIEVSGLLDTGAPYSIFYVDSFDLTYERSYQAVDNKLLCRGDGNEVVTISGFTDPAIYLFELSDPLQPKGVKRVTVDAGDNGYRISFCPAAPDVEYLALTADVSSTPVSLVAGSPSQWRRRWNRAEYVIIAPSELQEAAQGLADYRRGTGLASVVVELEDIYDEFNYGIASPQAVKAFLTYAYHNWRRAPGYVVLAGDGTYDYKDNQGYGDNLVPPIMVNTPDGLFASDNQFVDVVGDDGVPEMAVGRLPVMTAEELEAAIGKIMAYESGGGDGWTKAVLMVADNADLGGNFPVDSDEVAAIVPDAYTAERIYLSEYPLAEARQVLQDRIHGGALLVNFIGHAGMDRLAQEGVLLTDDVDSLENSDRPFVMTAMTCLVGRFAIPGYDTLSEALVLHGGGGAIAVWAPTGLSRNLPALFLDKEFFRAAFEDGEKVVGQSILRALEAYSGQGPSYMTSIYNLLGDPALKMK